MHGYRNLIPTTRPQALRATDEEDRQLATILRRLKRDGDYTKNDVLRVGLRYVLTRASRRRGLTYLRQEIDKERGGIARGKNGNLFEVTLNQCGIAGDGDARREEITASPSPLNQES